MADIQQQLATLLGKEAADIVNIRRNGSLYSLIDIAVMVTHNDVRYAAKEIGILCRRFPEVWNSARPATG